MDSYKCVINQASYILSEGDMVTLLKVNGIWKIVDYKCTIFCVITDRLNQYYKAACKKMNKVEKDSAVLNPHQ